MVATWTPGARRGSETAGTDLFQLERREGADAFELVAVPPDEAAPRRPHALDIGAYRRTPSGLERVASASVEVAGPRTTVDLPLDADLYLVNDDDLTFARTRPDAGSRDALFELAPSLPTAISRGVAVATVWDMLTNGEARTAEVVQALTGRAAGRDRGPVPRALPEARPRRLQPLVARRGARRADRPRGRRLPRPGHDTRASPGRDARARRAPPASRRSPELLAQDEDDIDLQWRLLRRLAELGGDVDEDQVRRLVDRDPDPESWVRALAVRAATPTAEDKEAVWQSLTVERSVPISSVGEVATAFWAPGHVELLRPYAERYLELLPHLHAGGMIPAMVYSGRLFPPYGIDAEFIARAQEVATTAAPVVRRRLGERAEEVRRMLVARSL